MPDVPPQPELREPPPSSADGPSRAYAAFRLPPFSADDMDLWLTQVGCACRAAGIVDDAVKFDLLVANLPRDVAAQVRDVILATPPNFNALTAALRSRLAQSRAARLTELLRRQQLGDQRPSQLLLRMRTELGAAADVPQDSELLRTLFMQQLPQAARAALSLLAEDTPLEQLATAADRFMAASSSAIIAAVGASASGPPVSAATVAGPPTSAAGSLAPAAAGPDDAGTLATLCSMVASLTAAVSRLEAGDRDREPGPGNSQRARRPRSRSRPARQPQQQQQSQQHQAAHLCYYHYRFGAAARNCQPPCSWPAENDRA